MIDADNANEVIFYTLSLLSVSFALVFLYVLLKKSPSAMQTYRITLLNMLFWYLISALSFGLFLQPIYTQHGSMSCAKSSGLAARFGIPGLYASGFVAGICTMNACIAIVLVFFYRYVTLAHPKLSQPVSSLKGFIFGFAVHAVCTVVFILVGLLLVRFAEILKIENQFLFCVDAPHHHSTVLVASFLLLYVALISVAGVVLVVLSIRALQSKKSQMSAKTYQLQRLLTWSLVVLVTLPILFDSIPIGLAAVAVIVKSEHLYAIVSIASHLPFVELVLVCVFTIAFVKPYRNAVLELFQTKNVIAPIVPSVNRSIE